MYAAKMRNQRPSRFAQRREPRRSIELVGFLRHSLADHTDTLIRMVDRRVSQLWGRASKKAKTDQGALPALTVLVAGAATYVHTHGWQGIFSDRSIMITQRQPGPAIDGILGQELSRIARVYTDTHGFSASRLMAEVWAGPWGFSCARDSRTTKINDCMCRAAASGYRMTSRTSYSPTFP